MILRDRTLQRQHELNFDGHSHKVPFVTSWPNNNFTLKKYLTGPMQNNTVHVAHGEGHIGNLHAAIQRDWRPKI